jgi:thiamine pyridinylase
MRILLRMSVAIVALFVCGWSGPCSTKPKTRLSVALFPYIPDAADDNYKALVEHLESDFEKANTDIDLVLRPLNQNDNFYKFETLQTWLTSDGTSGYDVVEVDAVLLRDLREHGLIRKWKIDRRMEADWHPAAINAVTIDGDVFGFPHLLCGHFVFSRDSSVADARSVDEMVGRVQAHGKSAKFGGDMQGGWNVPALYIDSWFDSHPGRNPADAIADNLDSSVLRDLARISALCSGRGGNRCLAGSYELPDTAAEDFAKGELTALLGYSEELYYIRKRLKDTPTYIAMAPLGRANNPIVFVDALTVRSTASERVLDAATRFAQYLTSPSVQEFILMSEDGPTGAIPRYIIPAETSAYTATVMRDPFFARIKRDVAGAVPFPNGGLPEARKAMEKIITSALKGE